MNHRKLSVMLRQSLSLTLLTLAIPGFSAEQIQQDAEYAVSGITAPAEIIVDL